MRLIPRLFSPPKQSFFLFGPRGTGKSTWIRQNFPDAVWIDLTDLGIYRIYLSYPERIRELINAYPKHKTIVIDEIQKIPEMLSMVHALIEEKRGLQFVMTGSSTRKLLRAGANLLAGRALLEYMHPFIAHELKDKFSLKNALKLGMLPMVFDSAVPEKTLSTYVGLYLKDEVQAEGLVRQIDSFGRFLETISFSHGSVLNTTNVARECGVKRKTVENYLQVLQDLLLSFTLPVFTKRAQRAVAAHPKFYLFDSGVFRSLRPKGPFDRLEEIEGAALEGLVAQHLRAWRDMRSQADTIYFWRTRTELEVDFVVYGPDGVWAIEVKNTNRLAPHDFSGLSAFKKDYPEAQCILLHRGAETLKHKEIHSLPCEAFLLALDPKKSLRESLHTWF